MDRVARSLGYPPGSPLGEISDLRDRMVNMEADNRALADELSRLKVAEDVTEDWLQVPFRFVAVPTAATGVLTRTISGDGPFDLIEVTHLAFNSATLAVNDSFRLRIKEGEAVGRTLTLDNEFIEAVNGSGTAQRPYIIKGRRRYRANVAIVVEVTNTLAAANTIEVVLHGIKVFTR